jgi:hypothetical protein
VGRPILTVITVLEVWGYYIPSLVASPFFVPLLLIRRGRSSPSW